MAVITFSCLSFFQVASHISMDGFQLHMKRRLTLDFCSSSLHFQSTRNTDIYHYTQFMWCWVRPMISCIQAHSINWATSQHLYSNFFTRNSPWSFSHHQRDTKTSLSSNWVNLQWSFYEVTHGPAYTVFQPHFLSCSPTLNTCTRTLAESGCFPQGLCPCFFSGSSDLPRLHDSHLHGSAFPHCGCQAAFPSLAVLNDW